MRQNNRNNPHYHQQPTNNRFPVNNHRSSMPTWSIVLLSVVGTAVAGIGTFAYFNKSNTPTLPAENNSIIQPTNQEPNPNNTNTVTNNNKPNHQTNVNPNTVKIISSIANYETITKPVKSCEMVTKEVTVANPEKNNGTTGALIGAGTGALAGGIIGNQVKNGKGTVIGGLIGAAAGAVAGNEIGKAQQPKTITKQEQVQECNMVEKSVKQIVNYSTTYNYQGVTQTVTTHKAYKKGSTVALSKLK